MNGKARPGRGGLPKTTASASAANGTPSPPEEWSSVAGLCAWLGVEPNVVYWARYQGHLVGYKVGRELRFHRDDIIRFLAARRAAS